MTVNENTLVMANTHGLHRRRDAKKGRMRIAIQFWTREKIHLRFYSIEIIF